MTMMLDRLREMPPDLRAAIRAELGPSFVNPQQRAFFDCEASEVLYSGAFRAGKSRIGCEKAYWLADQHPGMPIRIFRKTPASLAASTQPALLHHRIPPPPIVRSHQTERRYDLANGRPI